ncbi:MAG: exo-alpha-sialidase [Gammaproteobacteria bacterium]|nr:exo-alpha-sialidase [Gammaproteobacteria bacterium]
MKSLPGSHGLFFIFALCLGLPGVARGAWLTFDHPDGTVVPANTPRVAVVQDQAAVLRLNAKGEVVFARDGSEQVLAAPRAQHGRISLPALQADASGTHVFWRTKLGARIEGLGKPGDKFVYVRSSQDGGKTFGPARQLSSGDGAFEPKAAGNGDGAVYAVWVDERHGPYHVFLNASRDAGRSWQAQDTKLDVLPPGRGGAFDPALLAAGEQVWVAWTQGARAGETAPLSNVEKSKARRAGPAPDGGKNFALVVRRSADRARTWEPPVTAAYLRHQPGSTTLVRAKEKLFLFWYDVDGIQAMTSSDDGRTWMRVENLPVLPDIASLSVAADAHSGGLVLAYTHFPQDSRPALYAMASADGKKFDSPKHLPDKPAHSTTSLFPEIVFGPAGNVLVMWQDSRYIRSTVCARLSEDGGRSWAKTDRCLEEQPGKYPAYFPRGAVDGQGRFHAVWVRYTSDRFQKSQVVQADIDRAVLLKPDSGGKPDRGRLEARAAGFWKTRTAGDWLKSYDYFDPFYRAQVRREAYVGTQGTVKYHDFKIEQVDIAGSVAQVRVHYSMEIPELDLQGKIHNVPKRDEVTVQEWIWIDDDWHLAFKDLMNQTFFRY